MSARLYSGIAAVAECFVIGAFIAGAALVAVAAALAPCKLG
jgi:hypothetical protein